MEHRRHLQKGIAELHAELKKTQDQVKNLTSKPSDAPKRSADSGPAVKLVNMSPGSKPPLRKNGVDVASSPWKDIFALAGDVFHRDCQYFADFF